ncbi:conjugal transfer protein TraC [Candidatus Berkelbacteria bacterium CG06_land_8_20_14_3_00_43_10]|nr:MAG: conjugal transfer protein TraC [Candidatus Berkelbacteria bacterium CG06_land_8_20_14_3_00_43_10]
MPPNSSTPPPAQSPLSPTQPTVAPITGASPPKVQAPLASIPLMQRPLPGVAHTDSKKQPSATDAMTKKMLEGRTGLLDIIAPAAFVVTPNFLQLNNTYLKSFFVYTYPRFLNTNWLSPVINFDMTIDITMFVYPIATNEVMSQLRRRQSQLESTNMMQQEKGMVRDPELQTAIEDIDSMRDALQKGESRLFQFSLYFILYATTHEELATLTHTLESALGGMLIYTKQSFLQMEQGFNSTLPLGTDELRIMRNMDTGSLSTTFPFTSATLSSNEGILYGINRHNSSLILFDRFKLENANTVVFARSGAGKSYTVKLEAIRYLMVGTDIIVIDPENEYEKLAEALGGSFIPISLNSDKRINPFDLPPVPEGEDGETVLRSNIAMATGLIALMVGTITPEESGLIDKALYQTYALKDITTDPATFSNPPPLLQDFVGVLRNMSGTESLTQRLNKYIDGSFAGLFTQPTNIDLGRGLIAFSIRDLEEQLRPIGMYLILTYIWNKVRHKLRRRILILDEAWILMQHEDSARFVNALVKRARKYYLGVTVISQDVEDFLGSQYGRSILNNASMQILLKQSTTTVEKLAEAFKLTDGEKFLLLESGVGEGLFFAGQNHVAIKIVASYTEDQIITTNPQQLLALKEAAKVQLAARNSAPQPAPQNMPEKS